MGPCMQHEKSHVAAEEALHFKAGLFVINCTKWVHINPLDQVSIDVDITRRDLFKQALLEVRTHDDRDPNLNFAEVWSEAQSKFTEDVVSQQKQSKTYSV